MSFPRLLAIYMISAQIVYWGILYPIGEITHMDNGLYMFLSLLIGLLTGPIIMIFSRRARDWVRWS